MCFRFNLLAYRFGKIFIEKMNSSTNEKKVNGVIYLRTEVVVISISTLIAFSKFSELSNICDIATLQDSETCHPSIILS
jgi:hypothetical protein